MRWRDAIALDRWGEAIRSLDTTDPGHYLQPRTIRKNEWGEYICFSVAGKHLVFSEADKFHDWRPMTLADAITALGNVSKLPEPEEHESARGPLEAYMEDDE